jgi:hypothetical protein
VALERGLGVQWLAESGRYRATILAGRAEATHSGC